MVGNNALGMKIISNIKTLFFYICTATIYLCLLKNDKYSHDVGLQVHY